MANTLKNWALRSIRETGRPDTTDLIDKRFAKFRTMGVFREAGNGPTQASGLSAG
jgi:hypothetical protein